MPTKTQILEAASSLGPKYSLGGVYTLEDLGLDRFPITRTGKVRKQELKEAVLRMSHKPADPHVPKQGASSAVPRTPVTPPLSASLSLSESSEEDTLGVISKAACSSHAQSRPIPGAESSTDTLYLVAELSSIVSDILGSLPSPSADLRGFMDSVSLLRYTDRVLRRLGKKLYLQDVLVHPTLEGQAALLESRGNHQVPPFVESASRQAALQETSGVSDTDGTGPFELHSPLLGSMSPSLQMAALVTLKELHLSPQDIEGVYPIKANYHRFISKQRPQTYRHRSCFGIHGGATAAKTRQALEAALATRSLLRTILVRVPEEQAAYHIAVRAHAILPQMITATEVADAAGLEALRKDDAAAAFHPHLAAQAQIVTVQANREVHLILTYSHTVFDLLSVDPFHRDIDVLISAPDPSAATLPPRTPFHLFTDLYHNYTDSALAKASIKATAHRLRGISKIPAALWPRQRAPGWMIGSDADADQAPRRALIRERLWAEEAVGQHATLRELCFPRVSRVVHLPDMQSLSTKRGVNPQSVAVAALAVLNVLQTRQGYAVFNTIDAGRTWPFVPASLETLLPSAMSVDGPMAEWLLHMLRVDLHGNSFESLGQFLGRIQRELNEAATHSHAPWDKVLEELGPEEGHTATDAVSRQTFVWDVSLKMARGQNDYEALNFEARYDWADW